MVIKEPWSPPEHVRYASVHVFAAWSVRPLGYELCDLDQAGLGGALNHSGKCTE